MTPPVHTRAQESEPGGWARWTVWLAGLAVALGAGVATAHGLYQVARAAGTPQVLAWLYPLITDGLALVAYATTTRLADHGRRYAWAVVVAAAGLSGLTQASYLAGSVATAPPALRFAIGAWPALAAAIVAHLLFLLGTTPSRSGAAADDSHPQRGPHQPVATATNPPQPQVEHTFHLPAVVPHGTPDHAVSPVAGVGADQPDPAIAAAVVSSSDARRQPADLAAADPRGVHRWPGQPGVQPDPADLVPLSNGRLIEHPIEHPQAIPGSPVVRASTARDAAPARIRAQVAATGHAARHGALPTVTQLMALAQVARGTAAAALKDLRQQPTTLQRHQKPNSDDET